MWWILYLLGIAMWWKLDPEPPDPAWIPRLIRYLGWPITIPMWILLDWFIDRVDWFDDFV